MSHLHLPDGVLPLWLWGSALALVVALLAVLGGAVASRRVAYQGSLGAIMLATMAIPLGPLDYHLSLAGPVGVLLGPVAAFQVVFVVSTILAFVGHGGFTVIGLNTLVLSITAVTAHAAFRGLATRMQPAMAMAIASAAGHLLSGVAWFGTLALVLRSPQQPASVAASMPHWEVVTAVVLALWLVGILVESAVAFGVARFLARVHPGLLPMRPEPAAEAA